MISEGLFGLAWERMGVRHQAGADSEPRGEVCLAGARRAEENSVLLRRYGALGADLLGVIGLRVHRIGGDDVSPQVEPFQQRGEGGDLVALRGNLPL